MEPSQQRLADLSLLYQLGSSFSAVLDLNELLRKILSAALQLLKAYEAQIVLIDAETGQLRIYTANSQGFLGEPVRVELEFDPLLTYVCREQAPLLIHPGESLHRFGLEQPTLDARLYVPLTRKQHTLGVLAASRSVEALPFSAEDQDLLSGLSSYAAIAVENALLYKQALDRSLELGLLVESADAVSSSLDLGRVLNAIARHLMRGLQTHWCVISGWNRQAGGIRKLAEYRSALWPDGLGLHHAIDDYPLHQRAIENSKPAAITWSAAEQLPSMRASLEVLAARRVLALPLLQDGQVIGLAELSNIHNGEPYTPLQIGQSLRRTLDLAPIVLHREQPDRPSRLRECARDLMSTAGADRCTLYLWEPGEAKISRLLAYGAGIWFDSAGPELAVRHLPTLRVVLREQRIATLRSTDESLDPLEQKLFDDTGHATLLVLPLVFRASTVGLVQLYDLNPARMFSTREMGLGRALANQAAVALENAHLVRDLQRSLDQQAAMQGHLVRSARLSALGELSAMIAHQINNPLTTILADAEMLVQDLPADDPEHASAQAILRAGQRAKKVVEHVLAMARGDDRTRPLKINDTIEETLLLLGPQITSLGIKLELELGEDLPQVFSSPSHLEDVWMNLLINARDAIMQKKTMTGRIRVRSGLTNDGKMIEVTVSDNGAGIAAEYVDRVFDPFFTTKPHGKGTGLGLYICQQIVGDHGGAVSLHSTPGDGTTVSVRLPVLLDAVEERDGNDIHRR